MSLIFKTLLFLHCSQVFNKVSEIKYLIFKANYGGGVKKNVENKFEWILEFTKKLAVWSSISIHFNFNLIKFISIHILVHVRNWLRAFNK